MTAFHSLKALCFYLTVIPFFTHFTAAAEFAGGTGEPNDPYQIVTAGQLIGLGEDPNLYDKHFILVNDINLDPNLPGRRVFTQAVIAPCVKEELYPNKEELYPNVSGFNGSFNGNSHRIRYLTIHGGRAGQLGLFGIVRGGRVHNLGLEDTSIIAANDSGNIGGLVGLIQLGTINGCYATGNVSGGDKSEFLGGLVGSAIDGAITNCYSTASISGGDSSKQLGGLAGGCYGRITNCYATGSVSSGKGSRWLGGLLGSNGGTTCNCYASGNVYADDNSDLIGGLVGQRWGHIINCYFLTDSDGGGPDNGVGLSLTDEQMKQQASFVGWDFDNVWTINEGMDYPGLRPDLPEPPKPSPPDLSRCTRVEIQLLPSTLVFFCSISRNHNLLSPEETAYLKSIQTIVLDDQERIKAFANDVGLLSYWKPVVGSIREEERMHFVCYHNGDKLTSFTLIANIIQTEDGHWFISRGFPSIEPFISQIQKQIPPFELRAECGVNMDQLGGWWKWYLEDENADPDPSKWCDAIVQRIDRAYGSNKEEVKSLFACPGAGDDKWHYAMNPHCKPDSPPDTVLLFETKAGWNQHGGPELFTFDNHDPKGGCVLLNDGTVKFIRTKKELHQLRWK